MMFREIFLLALLSSLLAGCITSRSPGCIGYNQTLSKGKHKQAIYCNLTVNTSVSAGKSFDPSASTWGSGAWAPPQNVNQALQVFHSVFDSIGLAANGENYDITLTAVQQNTWNPWCLLGAVISGGSYLCIPTWADDVFYLQVRATSKTGLVKDYLIRRTVTTSVWLPFIFAMPAADMPQTARDAIILENWKELRLRMERDGFFDKPSCTLQAQRPPASLSETPVSTPPVKAPAPPKSELANTTVAYEIVLCERESDNDFSYRFELELKGGKSLRAFRAVQQEFRQAIKEDYLESFPGVDTNNLFVDFPEYRMNNGKIEGRAVVLSVSVVSLKYDPNTRTGTLAVKVNANQLEEARKWIRKNIETLARDKNIALTTGEIPPAAKFYLGREEIKDGNILEIEFKTE